MKYITVIHTNLDLPNEDFTWVQNLPIAVGDKVQSTTVWGTFQLSLEVVSIHWERTKHRDVIRRIELHIPKNFGWSIREFYEWYAPAIGKSVGNFI